MAALVEVDEYNQAGVVTHGITNCNVGSADAPNLTVSPATAIPVGTNSMVKYMRLHVLDMQGATSVGGFTVWLHQPGGAGSEKTVYNLGGSTYPPAQPDSPPTTAALPNSRDFQTVDPGGANNIGIDGDCGKRFSGTDPVSAQPWVTDWFGWQVQTRAGAYGRIARKYLVFYWDEVP